MKKQSGIMRILTTLVGCALVLGMTLGIAGCGGNSDEKLIRSAITEVMDAFKNPTKENLQQFVDESDVNLEELEEYGVDIYEFMGHCFAHFDYSIDSVNVDGDTASATLSITNADLNAALTAATDDVTNNISEYADVLSSENAQQELAKILFQKLYDNLDASDDLVTTEATLNLTKVDGEWQIDDDSMSSVVSAMYGGMQL